MKTKNDIINYIKKEIKEARNIVASGEYDSVLIDWGDVNNKQARLDTFDHMRSEISPDEDYNVAFQDGYITALEILLKELKN